MKFTDGFWETRDGFTALYAQEAHDVWADNGGLRAFAPTKRIVSRGDTLNRPMLTVSVTSPLENVVRVRISHHEGVTGRGGFELPGLDPDSAVGDVVLDPEGGGSLSTGDLRVTIGAGAPWSLDFSAGGERLTGSGHRSVGHITADSGRPSSTSSSSSVWANSCTDSGNDSGRS
ncbi:hypothetical protein GCM10025867_18580 [Frondihabitans sucicola]|uniref:Alpha-xylosidase n=1 Tax=Frondihabitans sucicola TaxID=1268041 RepID=A0ABM8GMG7_9MICO|nr:hypothetical protein GCM10025867_18580 [Frondihabitans sucicola]